MAAGNAIVQRNRENSLKSTGPKTVAGKAMASRNRLRHGLRANPAALDGEDRRQFQKLLTTLTRQIRPRGILEAGLVHQIATALWRKQKSAAVESALGSLAVRAVAPLAQEAQEWIERVNDAWRVEDIIEADPALLKQRRAEGRLGKDQQWIRTVRPYLHGLDLLRQDMMRCGAGVTALLVMLDDLVSRLKKWQGLFHECHAERLAWLLGDPANSFWTVAAEDALPHELPRGRSPNMPHIDKARWRKPGESLPAGLRSRIDAKRDALRQQRRLSAQQYTRQEEKLRETAALLPDEETLNRLIRYETHADRSLQRAIDSLAKLRGATYELLSSRMVGRMANGTVVALEQQRTRGIGRGLSGKKLPNEARGARDAR